MASHSFILPGPYGTFHILLSVETLADGLIFLYYSYIILYDGTQNCKPDCLF